MSLSHQLCLINHKTALFTWVCLKKGYPPNLILSYTVLNVIAG